MGTLITGGSYEGSTDYFDGPTFDAGEYDSVEELNEDNNEAMTDEWAENQVSDPGHLVDATGGDLSDQETNALQDVFGSGGSGDSGGSSDSGSSPDPSMPSVPQVLPIPSGGGSSGSGIGTTGILLAVGAAVVAIIMGGR